ncbi:MAG: hypothetical protein B6I38_01365, partial [Anaerolineaceae bacterium 4572_5.1]
PEFLLRGAVSYGNDNPAVLAANPNEQPWNLTVIDGDSVGGDWTLAYNTDKGKFELNAVKLTFENPDVILNGFFWLSTGQPTVEDALPSVDNWVSGLRSIPLETAKPGALFPSPVQIDIGILKFSLRPEQQHKFELELKEGELSNDISILEKLEHQLLEEGVVLTSTATISRQETTNPPEISWIVQDDLLRYHLEKENGTDNIQVFSIQPPSAALHNWSLQYQEHRENLVDLISHKILPADIFSRLLPLLWLRHETLPMIQSLPLTQSQSPPSYPSPSRQLVPFELPISDIEIEIDNEKVSVGIPDGWEFKVNNNNSEESDDTSISEELILKNGAVSWLNIFDLQNLNPAQEWQSLYDLPLVSLSLPGLLLDPKTSTETTGLADDVSTRLPVQYRFDLPYTDEINALAQLPKQDEDTGAVSPLADEPPPEQEKPLTRETLAEHWQQLSERAGLAALDAVDAFIRGEDGQIVIQNLIEPLHWPGTHEIDLTAYPGKLTVQNDGKSASLELQTNTALKGISGNFDETSNGNLVRQAKGKDGKFSITAGSMTTEGKDARLRDQRGLYRDASTISNDVLIETPLEFQRANGTPREIYKLASLQETCLLHLTDDDTIEWNFWFRDLPLQDDIFLRNQIISRFAEDINDPEALSREQNFLNGYEWRLIHIPDPITNGTPTGYLPIFNLHFYPLTLEQVTVNDQTKTVTEVQIVGRLQLPVLPLENDQELADFNNAVRVTFSVSPVTGSLTLSDIALETASTDDISGFEIETNSTGASTWTLRWNNSTLEMNQRRQLLSLPGDPVFKQGIRRLVDQLERTEDLPSESPYAEVVIPTPEVRGEWPLALNEKSEMTAAPLLLWNTVSLRRDDQENVTGIDIEDAQLKFFLFEAEWTINLTQALEFPTPRYQIIPISSSSGEGGQPLPLSPQKVMLDLPFSTKASIEVTFECPSASQLQPVDASLPFKPRVLLFMQVLLGSEAGNKLPPSLAPPAGQESNEESAEKKEPPPPRVTDDLQTLYTFTQDGGNRIFDVSGATTILDMEMKSLGGNDWIPGGLQINSETMIISPPADAVNPSANKIVEAIQSTREFTFEAWLEPDNVEQSGPAHIISLTNANLSRQITLGQGLWGTQPSELYSVRLKNNDKSDWYVTGIWDNDQQKPFPTGRTHLVYTHAADGTVTLYLRPEGGELQKYQFTASNGVTIDGDWQPNGDSDQQFRLVLANSLTGNQPWLGTFHMVAIYDRALTKEQVDQNFEAGIDAPPPLKRTAFTSDLVFHVLDHLNDNALGDKLTLTWQRGYLFSDMELLETDTAEAENVLLSGNTLQFQWKSYSPLRGQLQLLPGIHLKESDSAPGFAALTFEALSAPESDTGVQLQLVTGFVETLITCHWGKFLQNENLDSEDERIFGSSAGRLTFGYTSQWDQGTDEEAGRWDESFLLNGFLEIKNLISWPLSLADTASACTLPDVDTDTSLNHVRHTIRILFNQHEIPAEKLGVGRGELLFNLLEGEPWQFLAVVEHQLADTEDLDSNGWNVIKDRRWTALQEVRLVPPATFKEFLVSLDGTRTLTPNGSFELIGSTQQGYLQSGVHDYLTDPAQRALDDLNLDTLIVEASAPHWIKQHPIPTNSATFTTLQFLPQGTQLGILSQPQDYAPTDPSDPAWMLLTMPFMGRLQAEGDDGLKGITTNNAFRVDPILNLDGRQSQPTQLVLALTSRVSGEQVTIQLSSLDTVAGRSWARLDPTALEENWFRFYNPQPESVSKRVLSITAALPDTPARLSRSTALRYAFDAFRQAYPPAMPKPATPEADVYEIPSPVAEKSLIWRQNSLLAPDAVTNLEDDTLYSWSVIGFQILKSNLGSEDAEQIQRYVAVTLTPARSTSDLPSTQSPLSLAVSPYLGLDFTDATITGDTTTDDATTNKPTITLISAELLCLDKKTNALRPVASHIWEEKPDKPIDFRKWAAETHIRLASESSLAILRFRKINIGDNAGSLTVDYSFDLVPKLQWMRSITQRVFRLRSTVRQLRFREGQFVGAGIPEEIKPFELASPQTTAVQPLYLSERIKQSNSQSNEPVWPWGLSGLRVNLRYTKKGTVGVVSDTGYSSEQTLWWQAQQHIVQYRSALNDSRPTAGLPSYFRAAAIKSLLPALPNPKLPVVALRSNPSEHNALLEQPVLPANLRYLLLGNRPGAMLAVRNQLLRQRIKPPDDPVKQSVLVSGSSPVQHRMPRPVPIPANKSDNWRQALQTWSSYFDKPEPDTSETEASPAPTVAFGKTPLDEAFLAEYGTCPARGLRMQMLSPDQGLITSTWDGNLSFGVKILGDSGNSQNALCNYQWKICSLELFDGEQSFGFQWLDKENKEHQRKKLPLDISDSKVRTFVLRDEQNAVRQILSGKQPGDILTVKAHVLPKQGGDNYAQTLTFPLRVGDEVSARLPLQPSFIYFEDPEYNRRLVSQSGHASKMMLVSENGKPAMKTVKLSTDRREYNPDSQIALRYDWEDNNTITSCASIQLHQITPEGVPIPLAEISKFKNLKSDQLAQFSLLDLRKQAFSERLILNTGDALQLTLSLKYILNNADENCDPDSNNSNPNLVIPEETKLEPIVLKVDIIAEPVTPVPDAAYALLRQQTIDDTQQVECVRFAWGPEPSRIELVCPEDLTTELVRRRAVFKWTDSIRPGMLDNYAIQKIAQNGSTHFPLIQDNKGVLND